jgi:hypothetical protein
MKKTLFLILFSLLILTSCSSNKEVQKPVQAVSAIDQYKINAAITAAEVWLDLSDQKLYDQCYDVSATLLQNTVTKESLSESLKNAREPLGALSKRTLIAAEYFEVLPGAPSGEYVVIQYSSYSESNSNVIETITPMLNDGVWKVSGYYIR